ncbi:MAG: flagellar hook protein FlgE [Rubrivivax sp.]|nr:flagellar hook protein FlgE [Rubrivivax sp.]
MSFQQGLSGLNATNKHLEIIGNNIANSNTFGAKISRAEFADMYAAALNGSGSNNIGIGVNLQSVSQQFTQGNITTTENPMDLAINGSGFFQLTDGRNPVTYSRNGQFKINRDGFIVNNTGDKLVGYMADADGVILPGAAVPLQLPTAGIAPRATTGVDMEMNLDARLPVTTPASGAQINFQDPRTFNNATSVTVYDAKGQDIALTYYFQKSATDTWNIFATANGSTLLGTSAAPLPIGTVNYAANGSAPLTPAGPMTFDIPSTTNGTGAVTLAMTGVELDLTDTTQYGSPFGVTDMLQDGFSAGMLTTLAVESDGIVMARYSNGESKPAGQIELATFRNPQGLQPLGGNGWGATLAAGDAVVGVPGQGNMGVLQSGALEESNIDLTSELVAMITAQRTYQANAQTIKTQDSVLQTLVNLR